MDLSMIDPDDGQVALDRAEAGGLMAYPDILTRDVRVRVLGSQRMRSGVGFPQYVEGRCVQVGPLGFVLEKLHTNVRDERETAAQEHAESLDQATSIQRIFLPWSAAAIEWAESGPAAGDSDPVPCWQWGPLL